MSRPSTRQSVVESLFVVLSLALNSTKLQMQPALNLQLEHPVRDGFISEKVFSFHQINRLLHVSFALFQHTKLLKAKSHVMVRDECVESVSSAVLKVQNLQDTFVFLKQHVCLLVLLFLYEIVGDVCQF